MMYTGVFGASVANNHYCVSSLRSPSLLVGLLEAFLGRGRSTYYGSPPKYLHSSTNMTLLVDGLKLRCPGLVLVMVPDEQEEEFT